MKYKVLGMDPSMRNWGTVEALLDPETLKIEVTSMRIAQTEATTHKSMRKNSDDISRAVILNQEVALAQTDAIVAFCEVPHGSQSARAMASYGVCCGVLGSLRIPLIELTATEVKLAATGLKTATKNEMIEWACKRHPEAKWLRYTQNGKGRKKGELHGDNEHLADALASIYAGLRSPQFATVLHMLRATNQKATVAA